MVDVRVGGASPDYPGDSHTTIVGLLTKMRDTFIASGWTIIADTIIANNDFTVADSTSTVFLRISHINNSVTMEASNQITFATTSTSFECGKAIDGDDTRLYMQVKDRNVGIGTWSNNLNQMNMALAGYPDVFYHPTLGRDVWWILNPTSTGWMYAECSNWLYDGSEWMSWNVAHSNETTNIRTTNTYTYAGEGFQDICVNTPYQLDNDTDNDRNAGYFHFNGRENPLDGSSALAPLYMKIGRNDLNGDDGDYGAGETKRGVNVNKGTWFTGYWTDYARGCASEDQRTILTDQVTGFVYVTGSFEFQAMRIA